MSNLAKTLNPTTVPMYKFEVQNLPNEIADADSHGWNQNCDDSVSTPSSPSSSGSWDHSSKVGAQKQTRRRRRGAKTDKKVYNSPPHDAPMTKNDIYFALDCEVSFA